MIHTDTLQHHAESSSKMEIENYMNYSSFSDYNTDLKKAKELAETQLAHLKIRYLELEKEKKKAQSLLYEMLPPKIAERMRNGHEIVASHHTEVTMMFLDICDFTKLSSSITCIDLIELLNKLYSSFDEIVQKYNLYKVETVGDAYMVVGNLLEKQEDHAKLAISVALEIIEKVKVCRTENVGPVRVRIGVHTGECLAGVLGDKMPRYVLFGECVNGSEYMESKSRPMRIHLSEATHSYVRDTFQFEEDREYDIHNRTQMSYFIVDSA